MLRKLNIKYLVFPILLVSCTRETTFEGLQEYIYNPKNGFVKSTNSDKVQYTMTYKPYELVFRKNKSKSDTIIDGIHYFQLSLAAKKGGEITRLVTNIEDLTELTNSLNSGILNKIYILNQQGDTTYPQGVQYSNTYNHGNANSLLLLFKNERLLEGKKVSIYLESLPPVDYQEISFEFKVKDIRKFPQLKNKEKDNEN
jgi:hypothetical protein